MSTAFSNFNAREPGAEPIQSQLQPGVVPGPEVSASPSDPTMLRKLYSAMLRCRMVEERAARVAPVPKRKPWAYLARGLEATVVGSLVELRAGDGVASEFGFAAHIHSEGLLARYFAERCGIRGECLSLAPKGAASIHLLPAAQSVAAQMNIAAGFALALKRSHGRNVVLVQLQDSATALGYWHEAATLAVAERLPIIFVLISGLNPSTLGNGVARQRAEAYGMPGITVDGSDAVAVWRVTQESIHRARSGAGPTLVESQLQAGRHDSKSPGDGDPVAHMQHYLEQREMWHERWKYELVQRFSAEIKDAESVFRQSEENQQSRPRA